MTNAQKTEYLKTVTGETNDAVIAFAMNAAKEAILRKAFPFLSELPSDLPARYENRQVEIAAFLILKQGAEGEKEHSELGIKRIFESGGIPDSYLSDIVPRMKTMRTLEEAD